MIPVDVFMKQCKVPSLLHNDSLNLGFMRPGTRFCISVLTEEEAEEVYGERIVKDMSGKIGMTYKKRRKKMKRLEFVSYNGEYPNLCRGVLTVKVDGKEVVFPEHFLRSRGSVWFDKDWQEYVESGEWEIDARDLPPDFPADLLSDLLELVNKEIPHGCCGGCV